MSIVATIIRGVIGQLTRLGDTSEKHPKAALWTTVLGSIATLMGISPETLGGIVAAIGRIIQAIGGA
jgi:hypothetical protein|tara:strand:- start:5618 stop:5818 length:201 start_codon:yes stop_codon:yes gene_type:complete